MEEPLIQLGRGLDILVRLARHGLIHCDLNEFNLMVTTPSASFRFKHCATSLSDPCQYATLGESDGAGYGHRLPSNGLCGAPERAVLLRTGRGRHFEILRDENEDNTPARAGKQA